MRTKLPVILLLFAGSVVLPAQVVVSKDQLKGFGPLPTVAAPEAGSAEAAKIGLGRMLYYDARLSKDQKLSCNGCHALDKYGVDGDATSTGFKGQHGDRNAPTVYNAFGHFRQFWDGRAATVEEQAAGPITNPVEMALPDAKAVERVLRSIPGYKAIFAKAFPGEEEPVTIGNAAKAIGAFERGLVTPSRWDAYLGGKDDALTDAEKRGFLAFRSAGCSACHNGTYIGGSTYQKLGLRKMWEDEHDLGRFKVTANNGDKLVFKVPSLRNIDRTGPYFHDGRVQTLDQAVTLMGQHQVATPLEKAQVESIVVWLKSLTGELPTSYIKKPKLPASGPQTPKADTE